MARIKRRILKAKISFLSLCPRGMNQIQTIYKADDGENKNISLATIVKDMSEQGELVAVVYAPDAVDGEGDTASAEVIKEFAYDFAANGKGIDIRHNSEQVESKDAYIAESFIIQKDDPRFVDTKDYDGNTVDVTGGWGVVLKIDNEDLRKQYRDGEWGGISMGGLMLAKNETESVGLAKALVQAFKSLGQKNQEKEMKDSEIKDLIAKSIKETFKAVEDAKLEETKKAAEDKKAKGDDKKIGMGYPVPLLKENPTVDDLKEHAQNLQIFELSKAVDPANINSVATFITCQKKILAGEDIVEVATKKGNPYAALRTNQDGGDVRKMAGASENEAGDIILAKMDKEKKERTTGARLSA